MASSMMHLAVVQEMKKKIRFQNAERLDLGVILPDAAVDGNSHLKRSICGGTKDTYDLEFFREKLRQFLHGLYGKGLLLVQKPCLAGKVRHGF